MATLNPKIFARTCYDLSYKILSDDYVSQKLGFNRLFYAKKIVYDINT